MQDATPKPRVLLYDLETSPRKVYVWGHYEQNVLKVVENSYMLCFSYKWLGDKETHTVALRDFPRYKVDKKNDKDLVKKLHELMEEADIVIAHNAKRFDNKWSNKQFIKHGLDPASPFRVIDTLTEARKHFRFDSNKLDDLGEFLDVGRKVKHQGIDLWFDVMEGKKEAWDKMLKYAKQDVVLLEKVYLKMRPWIKETPFTENDMCSKCGSYNLMKKGTRTLKSGMIYPRYKCKDCGGWLRGRFGERKSAPLNAN